MVRSAPLASTAASRAPCASKWSAASRKPRPVRVPDPRSRAPAKPGGRLRPVPTAVPPSASSASVSRGAIRRARCRARSAARSRRTPVRAGSASRPSGACARSSRRRRSAAALLSSAACSRRSAGSSSSWIASRAATWRAVGITSLEDWPTVHVVVRMDRPARRAQPLLREARDHLVRVHVGRGARAGLEHVEQEVRVVASLGDLARGELDRARHAARRARRAGGSLPQPRP